MDSINASQHFWLTQRIIGVEATRSVAGGVHMKRAYIMPTLALIAIGFGSWYVVGRPGARSEPQRRIRPAVTRQLKVASFNVQFLPGPGRIANKRKDAVYRARAIAERLAAYDILGFNETFDKEPRETLLGTLGSHMRPTFHVVLPGERERSVFGWDSGLAIVSRLPIIASHTLKYDNDSSVLSHGLLADGFVKKGAMHARVAWGDLTSPDGILDVFITHIESQDSNIRDAQLPMFADFVRKHSTAEAPVLIMGDFNTDGRPNFIDDATSQYHRMLKALQAARLGSDVIDVWPSLHTKLGGTNGPDVENSGERIDYIFISNPRNKSSQITPLSMRVNRMLDSRVVSLSDHCAVEAEIEWRIAQ
jgi:endonuclease/exonuclease/phosphatase family metal-dependent hydrolase